ncbi:MAG: ABC transporter permease [Acidimicrobiia bacterium]|nr:ABC transporter permease [Acidimicrobiia bacterium]
MRFLLRRLVQLVVVLLVVSFLSFLLLELLPGDPVVAIVPFSSEEQREILRHDLGLDQPLPARYWDWLSGFVTGDLGNYYTVSSVRPVSDDISGALPVSLQLMGYSMILTLVLAVPVAVFAAYRAGSLFDRIANTTAFGAVAIPDFAIGLVLAYYLGVQVGWFPTSGYRAPSDGFIEHLKSMAMPAISLAVGQVAAYMRLLRSDMIATLREDFIAVAKAKGMPPGHILWRHALRPSSLTLLTVVGLNIGTLIGGAVVIEAIFQLPGMGLLIFQSISTRQYVALQSFVALLAIGYVAVNAAVDLLYAALDPRISHGRASR